MFYELITTVVLEMTQREKHPDTKRVGRPIDYQRRADLLDALVDFASDHGFAELSWRPIASTLGVSPTTLVHHFGTKVQMLEAIQGRLRERMVLGVRELAGEQPDLPTAVRTVWTRASDPEHGAEFRLFFAIYGRALQDPDQFSDFLEHVVADWMGALHDTQEHDSDPATATRTATLIIATIRGLLLDLLATGDHTRVQDAAESFIATLEPSAKRQVKADA
jgi:AcrR family transcriptional regulator